MKKSIYNAEPGDLMKTAEELNNLMQEVDYFEYINNDYSVQKAFDDLENDPYGVVCGLIEIIRDLTD